MKISELNFKEHNIGGLIILPHQTQLDASLMLKSQSNLDDHLKDLISKHGDMEIEVDHSKMYLQMFQINDAEFNAKKEEYTQGVSDFMNKKH